MKINELRNGIDFNNCHEVNVPISGVASGMQGGGASCPPPEEILGKMGLWEEIEKGRKRNNSG